MKKKILLVEDEVALLDLTALQLEERCEAEVIKATTAKEALEIITKEQIFMVITDLQLEETTGVELCKQIRDLNPVCFIIAVTGHQSLFQLIECRSSGFDDYFIKPVDFGVLASTVENSWQVIERWLSFNK
ncbi:MAG: response regulator [Lentisphaeraceae bacterium]|nr:response regulator [Lentisphaeraceae bacterium]MCM8536498.1 response regulator [Lentisphaeraceae bacterium]